jgi:hypothetical protein
MASDATIGSMYGSGPTRSFLGIPACEVLTPLEADAVVLGIPAATPYRGGYRLGLDGDPRAGYWKVYLRRSNSRSKSDFKKC